MTGRTSLILSYNKSVIKKKKKEKNRNLIYELRKFLQSPLMQENVGFLFIFFSDFRK